MAAPSNLSFETVGAGGAGTALSWNLVAVSSYEEIADFSGAPWETFEGGWTNDGYLFDFEPADIQAATYDTVIVDFIKTVENFEELWDGNESYVFDLDSPEPEEAVFDTGTPEEVEDFEEEWDANEDWQDAFGGGDLSVADFDAGTGGQQDETFTTWDPNWSVDFAPWGTDLADYNNAADAFEAFAVEQAPREFSVDLSTNVLTLVGSNPFADGDKVFVTAEGTYPAPLQSSQTYYVRDKSALTCKLALSVGGTAIDITGTATGKVFLAGDPVVYWTEKMKTTAL